MFNICLYWISEDRIKVTKLHFFDKGLALEYEDILDESVYIIHIHILYKILNKSANDNNIYPGYNPLWITVKP